MFLNCSNCTFHLHSWWYMYVSPGIFNKFQHCYENEDVKIRINVIFKPPLKLKVCQSRRYAIILYIGSNQHRDLRCHKLRQICNFGEKVANLMCKRLLLGCSPWSWGANREHFYTGVRQSEISVLAGCTKHLSSAVSDDKAVIRTIIPFQ